MPRPALQTNTGWHERAQDRDKRESPSLDLTRRPQPDLSYSDERQKGREEGDGPALEAYRLGVEAVGLVPAVLADVVAPAGRAFGAASGTAGLSSELLVGVLFLPAEAVPQALA